MTVCPSGQRKLSHFCSLSALVVEQLNIAVSVAAQKPTVPATLLASRICLHRKFLSFICRACRPEEVICSYFGILPIFIAATSSFEPDPHLETDVSAWVKGTSRGCTRSRQRI